MPNGERSAPTVSPVRRLVELERLVEVRLERGFAVCAGGFPVHFRTGHFGERAPVAAASRWRRVPASACLRAW